MLFKVVLSLKDVDHDIVMDDVYCINTYIECITLFRQYTGDVEYNYKWERIKSIKITSI